MRVRLLRLTLATLVGAVLIFTTVFASYVLFIGSAIAFSGSTGDRNSAFVSRFIPLVHFVGGAVSAGVVATLANAVLAARGWWVGLIIVAALLNARLADSLLVLAQPFEHLFALLFLKR